MLFDIRSQLAKASLFQEVAPSDKELPETAGSVLPLHIKITEYDRGSQAMCNMVGFGAGQTKIMAHIRYIDPSSEKTLLERTVDGKVVMGLFGGHSKGATNGLAKEVTKITKIWLQP